MVNLRQLEVFRAVMDAGTTGAAAELLNISQPAVSNMIRQTEDQLGFKLFERSRGRLWRTAEAETLYSETEAMFIMFRSVQQKTEDLRDSKVGSIRIAATPSVGLALVPAALKRFLAARPKVRATVDIRGTDSLVKHIDSGLAEVAVSMEPLEHPSITATPIHMGNMACVMPADHPLAELKSVRPADFASHMFVALGRNTPLGALVENAFRMADVPYRWQVETRYCNAACAMALEIGGVTVVDPYTIAKVPQDAMAVRAFVPAIQVNAYVVHSAIRPLSRLATNFIADLEASLR